MPKSRGDNSVLDLYVLLDLSFGMLMLWTPRRLRMIVHPTGGRRNVLLIGQSRLHIEYLGL
jgi:hypothetical protein